MIEVDISMGDDVDKLNTVKVIVKCSKCEVPMFECDNEIAQLILDLNKLGLRTLKSNAGGYKEIDTTNPHSKIITAPYVVFEGELQKYHRKIKEYEIWEVALQYYISFNLKNIGGTLVSVINADLMDISDSQNWIDDCELKKSILLARTALLTYLSYLIRIRELEMDAGDSSNNKEGQ